MEGKPAPSALLLVDDATALKILHACRELGIAVPKDLSLVGFDNVEDSAYFAPPLTTIDHPLQAICLEAVRQLDCVAHRGNGGILPKVQIPTSLVIRGSTAVARD